MRIAFIAPAYPLRGGIAQFSAVLVEKLIARGHQACIFSFSRQYPELLFPGKTQWVDGPDPHPVPSMPVIDTIDPRSWWRAARMLRDYDPDLVVFRYWMPFFAPCYSSIAALLQARRARAKIAFLVDNAKPHEGRPGDQLLTRLAFGRAGSFIALSQTVADQIGQLAPGKPCLVAPHPLYEIRACGLSKAQARERLQVHTPRMLLFFGFVRKYKGVDLLLEALGRLADPAVSLLVAGEFYIPEQPYHELVRRLGLQDRVRFINRFIPDAEVDVLFRAADAVVLPYRHATQSGIVHLAYQCGTPVIATQVGGMAESIEDQRSGLLCAPSVAGLHACLQRFYAEEWEERLREGVEQERGRFGWDPLLDAVEQLRLS